jgi:sulfur-oxidizing protein SoxA
MSVTRLASLRLARLRERISWIAGLTALLIATGSACNAEAPLGGEADASARPWTRYADWTQQEFGKFNTLADPTRSPPPKEGAVRKMPRGPGDPAKGMRYAFDRSRGGSCVACHVMGPKTPEVPGNVGPDLSEEGNAGRDDEWLFNTVYDARVYNPQTVMPPWGAHGFYNEEEIRDIVAFLQSLNQPASLHASDDPETRPVPVEDRDNLDPLVNPGMWAVENAEALWARPGPTGQACQSCHADPASQLKRWAASMPRWEKRLGRVLGVEEFVYRHSAATTGDGLLIESEENIQLAVYLRNLANDEPIKVDVESPGAMEAAARGRALMNAKIGQFNFACLDCHGADKGANHWMRGQFLAEPRGQVDHVPTWRTSRNEVWDIRKRFEWCNVAVRANELPPEATEYGDLELYLTSLSNGQKLSVPGIRY